MAGVTARYRAKLKAKKVKERARKSGLTKAKAGGRLKIVRNKEWRRRAGRK
jgi:hypothetical protein